MIEMLVNVICLLIFLSILEGVLGRPIIKPALHFGKMAMQGLIWTTTVAISATIGLAGFIARHAPAAISWTRSLRR